MIRQRTLKNVIRATGIGLHTGEKVFLTLRPAPVHAGVVFVRTDLGREATVPARLAQVVDVRYGITLGAGRARVGSVEHLLSAFAGLGIDNAYVEIDAPEVPVMDGSAGPFVFLLQSAGFTEQAAPKRFLRIRERVEVAAGTATAALAPHDGFRVECEVCGELPLLRRHAARAAVEVSPTSYVNEIARARTFGVLQEVERLQRASTTADTDLADERGRGVDAQARPVDLRARDEFARHAMLDAIGTLFLLGHGLIGAYRGRGAGTALDVALLEALLDRPEAFELETFEGAPLAADRPDPRPAVAL